MTYFAQINPNDPSMGNAGANAHISHFGALKTSGTIPVLKANFPGSSLNTTIWTETTASGGSTTVDNGLATLSTGTNTAGSVKLASVNQGIFEAGQITTYQSGVKANTGVADNIRIWGLMTSDEQDGLYFKWNGTTFQVVARKGGVETTVDSDSFNGESGWEPTTSNNTFRIFYSAGRAIFCRASAGNIVTLHTMVNSDEPLVDDLDMGLYYENTNSGNTTDVELNVRGASSSIFGNLPTIRANGAISDNTVMMLNKSVLTGRDADGTYQNIVSNSGGALTTGDFYFEVAAGNVANHIGVTKFGRNSDIDIGTAEDIWNGGGEYTGFPTGSPETVEVFSASANDASAGTGMRTVRIEGLKTSSSTAYETEDITLNGTTPVTSSSSWYRLNRAFGLTYGSGATNAGEITVRHTSTTSNVFIVMPALVSQTTIAAYTIPAGSTGYLVGVTATMGRANGSAGQADVSFRVRPFGAGGFRSFLFYSITQGTSVDRKLAFPITLPAQSDIKVRCDSVSDNNTIVTATMEIMLVSN